MNNKNFCVIMGGGVGSRFWPMSREHNPKQFLDLFGIKKSLLRMTFERFNRFIPTENILIVTNERYRDKVKAHIPELKEEQILLEPLRRNTAPCIAYASYHIAKKCPDANIVVAPSDHLILNEFAFEEDINKALKYTEDKQTLVTLGVTPSRPETGYGYIQVDNSEQEDGFIKVKTFTEKPDIEMAKVFVESGEFLWNSGMFVWNVQTILKALGEFIPDLTEVMDAGVEYFATNRERDFITENFSKCPTISIDYGVMEKAHNVKVLPVDFGWADLGTWGSLYDLSEKDNNMNVSISTRVMYHDATGNIVSSKEPNKLIVVQGINDCIISEADNVLLICKKSDEQHIKHFVAEVGVVYGEEYD